MNINIIYDHGEQDIKPLPIRDLVEFVLLYEGKPFNSELSLSFVSDETMTALNEKYRQKQGPTDVLSFENTDRDEDASNVFLGSLEESYELGDIVIAPDVAWRQTQEFGTSFEEEISLLVVHGVLHLCGYDHIEDEEAEHMEALEGNILKAWTRRRDNE